MAKRNVNRIGAIGVIAAGLVAGIAIGGLPGGADEVEIARPSATTTTSIATPASTTSTTATDRTVVAIMGDSFVGGSQMNTSVDTTWARLVRRELLDTDQVDAVDIYGMGGSGYIATGQRDATFDQAIVDAVPKSADVVVIMGGLNDTSLGASTTEMAAAVDQFYADLRERAPNAVIVSVGVVWPNSDPVPEAVAANDVIRERVAASGQVTTFVDALDEAWFSGANESLIGSDGTHPTDEGHAAIAERMLPVIEDALAQVA